MIVAAVYVPLWVPAAVLCVVCWLPGVRDDMRRSRAFVRDVRAGWAHRRKLNELWRDEVGADRGVAVPFGSVATTPGVGADDYFGDAA